MTDFVEATPHWHLLGAGAIGTLLGTALQATGHTVSVFLRDQHDRRETLNVSLVREGEAHPCTFPVAQRDDVLRVSHLLVTTKSYDVAPAVEGVAHLLDPRCQIVLLTNGMGLAEKIHATLPHLDVITGTTTEGAYRKSRDRVVHAGEGQTRLGQDGRSTPPGWFAQWQRSLADCSWDNDISSALWRKLAINCVINPLTALYGCRNGQLATDPRAARDVARLCAEVQQVSYACGFTETAQTLTGTVAMVIEGTAANRSSMLQDVIAGRRTEIDDITGYLLREAKRYGIPAPENQRMLESIHAL